MDTALRQVLLKAQRNEITEYHIYSRLTRIVTEPENKRTLQHIADDEYRHYKVWKKYTGVDVGPNRLKMWFYYLISRIFGFTFGIKLMEAGEEKAQVDYKNLPEEISEAHAVAEDENDHENELIEILDEERLRYTGSMVLGLNDALVELTGALAGLTLALQNTRLIALTGMITGVAAAFSMAASEYLSTKSEEDEKSPPKASLYTGTAYIMTVALLILPYLLIDNYYLCLAVSLMIAVIIIALFNYYIAVAKSLPFRSRFLEMAGLSLGVAALSFGMGYLIRLWLGVEV
ncbi:MAG: VIT1/CCC1 transporter family protein [Chitinivibrionales bacterium]